MTALEARLDLRGAGLGARRHEEIDMQLEVARADRDVDTVAVAADDRERLCDLRLRGPVEPHHAPLRGVRTGKQPPQRLRLERTRPQRLQLARRTGQRNRDALPHLEHDRGRGAGEPDDDRALGDRRLLADAVLKIRVRPVQARGDAP